MSWVIGRINIPIYGIFIVLSFFIAIIFNYIYLSKYKVHKRLILLSNMMIILFCIMFAKYFTIIVNPDKNLNIFNAGFTSYGGMIGILTAAFIFYKISKEKLVIKSNILVLPLMYSISKLGCFFAGCCYGIPYNNIFSVTYSDSLNIPLFPIQLLETIVFFILFIIGLKLNNKKNCISQVVILCALSKFLLEYLRYSHINVIISINQIVSLIIIFITILIRLKNSSQSNEK